MSGLTDGNHVFEFLGHCNGEATFARYDDTGLMYKLAQVRRNLKQYKPRKRLKRSQSCSKQY